MKARVKATGDIVDATYWHTAGDGVKYYDIDKSGYTMTEDELDFDFSYTPDYWTRLEHTYAGMAMQGMSEKYLKDYRDYCAGFGDMDKDEAKATMKDFADAMADVCYYFAHALVEKMKENEKAMH